MNAALLSLKQAIPLAQVTRRTPKPLDANDTRLKSIAATREAVQMHARMRSSPDVAHQPPENASCRAGQVHLDRPRPNE
jgi:hypothetical protein